MKPRTSELTEGREAWTNFNSTMRSLITVPHAELQRREAEYKKQADANPNKRGPKPKAKRAKRSA